MPNKVKVPISLIILELPPPDNAAYGQHGHIRYLTKKAKEWKEMVHFLGFQLCIKPIKGKVKMRIRFYLKRERDVQGSLKLLFDALEGIVYNNDKQVYSYSVKKFLDEESRKKPRIELKIEKL